MQLIQLHGFTDVEDLNERHANYPFADLLAVKDGTRYAARTKVLIPLVW